MVMAIAPRLRQFLEENQVPYEVQTHPEAYTAQEIAAALHVKGKFLAKVVMVRDGERMLMTVLPATHRVNLDRLREVLGSPEARLATEEEFKDLFPDCEPGAEPPFGNLYHLEVLVDQSLTEDERIYFNAGTHHETVSIRYEDFHRLVKPQVAQFAEHL